MYEPLPVGILPIMVLVTVSMIETVLEPGVLTYNLVPMRLDENGLLPTVMVSTTVFVSVSITETVFELPILIYSRCVPTRVE